MLKRLMFEATPIHLLKADHILRLLALRGQHDVKLNDFPFAQPVAVGQPGNIRSMNKDVAWVVVSLDESVAFICVEPLYSSA